MKGSLTVRSLLFDVAKLGGFPSLLNPVKSGIESEAVDMQMRVGNAPHGTGSEMHKFSPGEIPGGAIDRRPGAPNSCSCPLFHLGHGLLNCRPEQP
nr:hypothetical protein [Prosthecobacter fusiformis]